MTDPEGTSRSRVDLNGLLANERTLLAWVRTGVSLTTFGFVIARLGAWLRYAHPGPQLLPEAKWIGVLFVLIGAATNGLGILSFVQFDRSFMGGRRMTSGSLRMIAVAAAVTALSTGLGLYVLVQLSR